MKELVVRYKLRRIRRRPWVHDRLDTPRGAAAVLVPILGTEAVEVCGVLCLSTRSELLAYHELSRGTVDSTMVHPRDVFRTALLAHASSVVVAHNHPSGNPAPSLDDVALTTRLKNAGEIIGVALVDHLIVTLSGRYYSFKEAGSL